jgi:hypothetical protein
MGGSDTTMLPDADHPRILDEETTDARVDSARSAIANSCIKRCSHIRLPLATHCEAAASASARKLVTIAAGSGAR